MCTMYVKYSVFDCFEAIWNLDWPFNFVLVYFQFRLSRFIRKLNVHALFLVLRCQLKRHRI